MLQLIKNYCLAGLVILSVGFVSCNSCQHRKSAQRPNDIIYPEPDSVVKRKLAKCKEVILKSNDPKEAEAYFSYLSLKYSVTECLSWSLLMANKHNSANGCLWVYYGLTEFDDNDQTRSLKYLDKETRDMALKYLKKSIDLGNYGGAYYLAQYYFEGKYLPQDSVEGNRLMKLQQDEKVTRYGPDNPPDNK